LVEHLVDSCQQIDSFTDSAAHKGQETVDLDTGRIILARDDFPRNARRIRHVGLSQFRDYVRSQLQQAQSQPGAELLGDALAQIERTVIGRTSRYLVRFDSRVPALRTVNAYLGHEAILSAWQHPVSERSAWRNTCTLRDRSAHGCRLYFADATPKIGMLIVVSGAFGEEHTLGMVRWVARTSLGGWEAGLSLIRGAISLLQVQPLDASESTRSQLLVVNIEDAGHEGILAVLPHPVSTPHPGDEFPVPAAGVVLHRERLLETGNGFDLTIMQIREVP
jgi:hypothetical protein